MVYIIQTNTLIDDSDNPRDFQSMVFEYSSWDDYRDDLLNNSPNRKIYGTLTGHIKPKSSTIDKIIINDEYHLECLISRYDGGKSNIKAYKVDGNIFKTVVCR